VSIAAAGRDVECLGWARPAWRTGPECTTGAAAGGAGGTAAGCAAEAAGVLAAVQLLFGHPLSVGLVPPVHSVVGLVSAGRAGHKVSSVFRGKLDERSHHWVEPGGMMNLTLGLPQCKGPSTRGPGVPACF
jgi:hypothetical protein